MFTSFTHIFHKKHKFYTSFTQVFHKQLIGELLGSDSEFSTYPTTISIVLVVIIWLKIPDIFYLSIQIFTTPVICHTTHYNAFWRAFARRTGILSFLDTNPHKTLNTREIRAFSTQLGCDIIKMSAGFNSFLAFLGVDVGGFHFLVNRVSNPYEEPNIRWIKDLNNQPATFVRRIFIVVLWNWLCYNRNHKYKSQERSDIWR